VIVIHASVYPNIMSESPPHAADERDTKEARLEHPSGFLYLTRHESVPILVDALLDLPPGRESPRPSSPTTPGSPARR